MEEKQENKEPRQSREEAEAQQQRQEEIARIRMPKGKEVLGLLEQRLGGSRMIVKCFDNKPRICRVPGRLKRRLWLREGDIVLIEPWEFDSDKKGDVLFKYTKAQVGWLRRKGLVKI